MMRYTDAFENLGDSMNRQMAAIAELNMKTFGKMVSRTDLWGDFMRIKKPEDFLGVQMKIAMAAGTEALQYSQELCSIICKEAAEGAKNFTNTTTSSRAQSSSSTTSHHKGKEKE